LSAGGGEGRSMSKRSFSSSNTSFVCLVIAT